MRHALTIHGSISAALGLGLLAGCGPTAATSTGPGPVAAPTVTVPTPAAPTPTPTPTPVTWAEHYQRDCTGSITPPIVSLAGDELVLCESRFSLAQGRYEGQAALGVFVLDGDRAITDDFGDGGLSLRDVAPSGPLHRHVGGGRPEQVHASSDGGHLVALERSAAGSRLSTWRLPALERVRVIDLPAGAETLALAIAPDGKVRWYGRRGCTIEAKPCPEGGGRCSQRVCEPAVGSTIEPDGTLHPWDAVPPGLAALAFDPPAQWVIAIDDEGRRWIQATDDPTGRIAIEGRSTAPEWPGYRLALTAGASTLALADADGVELWSRRGARPHLQASLDYQEVEDLVLTADRDTLLVTQQQHVTVLHPRPVPARTPRPTYDAPTPAGWERAPMVDGRPQWPDDQGFLWPPQTGSVAWYRQADDYTDFRVVVGDRAEIGRPELDVKEWAELVLLRLDNERWDDVASTLPHTLRYWVEEDGDRVFELHYTTVGGCEQYEVVRRVVEDGDWLVRYELHGFAGTPWRDAWASLVYEPLGPPPAGARG